MDELSRSDIFKMLGPLKALIDQFISDGVVIPNISCTHVIPLVIVHKKEGKIQVAVNYRESQSVPACINQLSHQDALFQSL